MSFPFFLGLARVMAIEICIFLLIPFIGLYYMAELQLEPQKQLVFPNFLPSQAYSLCLSQCQNHRNSQFFPNSTFLSFYSMSKLRFEPQKQLHFLNSYLPKRDIVWLSLSWCHRNDQLSLISAFPGLYSVSKLGLKPQKQLLFHYFYLHRLIVYV